MDIKDFVKETLTQISDGICEANSLMKSNKSFVVASNFMNIGDKYKYDGYSCDKDGNTHLIRDVEFDIMVNVKDTSTSGRKGSIEVASLLKFGAGTESQQFSQNTNRVKFSLPLALPLEE